MTKPTKRELLAEYMYRKRNNPLDFYERMPQQQRFKDDPAKVKILFGGNRSGKSHEGGAYVVETALADDKRLWASGITFKDSINIQQRKVADFLPKGARITGSYNMQTGFSGQSVVLRNEKGTKSKVDFKSTISGPDKYQGDDLDLIWLDEEHPKSIVDECKMRLIDRDGELIITMTSLKGMTPFILDFWQDCEIVETRYAKYLDEYIPVVAKKNGVSFYFLWTTDNPHINQERLENEIQGMSRNEIKSRVYGIPVNLTGVIYPQYSKKVHCIESAKIPSEKFSIYTVLDPHDRKPWAIGWFIVHKTGSVIMVDEFPRKKFNEYYEHHTYEEYRDIIRETEEALLDRFKQPCVSGRFIDPNFGHKTVQYAQRHGGTSMTTPKIQLAELGLDFKDSVDGIAIGHLAVQRALSWREKNGQIVKAPGFYVCNNCINTLEALSHYACGENGKPLETYKDFADLVRYLIIMEPEFIDELQVMREQNAENNSKGRYY
jgi:phage terminase large subunit-like protein